MKQNKKGFTLIELLVVIAIIGLLSTLAVVALNNARQKSRDARRMSDIKQIQTALELYFNDEGGYPDGATAGQIVDDGNAVVGPTSGVSYMAKAPMNPSPGGAAYAYTQTVAGASYTITYTTEGLVNSIDCTGGCTATPAGIND